MLGQFFCSLPVRVLLLAVIAVHLVACGAGSGGNALARDSASPAADDIVLAGSVGDGPVTGAIVEVWTSKGRLVRKLKSDNTASFSARIRVWRSSYPLLLRVRGGIDMVTGKEPDFEMVSVMLNRYTRAVNINPFSTLIVKIAQSLPGGLNAANVGIATGMVTDKLGFGLDLNVIPDPINTPVTDTNAAGLMKSSEAAGEMVRRTRDLIAATGRETSGDAVLAAIAADLQDGRLDGQGAAGTDPRITAMARVVSGQVLVEALANTLKVGGIIATRVLDQAIVTTRSDSDRVALTRDVRTTDGMLQQTHAALAAASVLDSSAEMIALESIVSGIAAGALPDTVAEILPADSSRSLDNAILLVSTAGETQLAAVNAAAQTGTTGPGITGPAATGPDSNDPGTNDPATTDPGTTDPGTVDTGSTDPGTTDTSTNSPGTMDPDTVDTGTTDTVTLNRVPAISGFPARTVDAGTAYVFQPLASDADGDVLTFSINGKPAWTDFDTTTGRLSGTPLDSDTGTYSNIAIAVTDGAETASLPVFDLTVDPAPAPAVSGSFTLNWAAPVARADGSPLPPGEIGGFRIYYGSASGNYSHVVDVTDGSEQSATVNDVSPGTYHVVMTSYDTGGLESGYSVELVKYAR